MCNLLIICLWSNKTYFYGFGSHIVLNSYIHQHCEIHDLIVIITAPLPKNGAAPGVAYSPDHGSQRGGQGPLAAAGGAPRAPLAPSVPTGGLHARTTRT